MHKNVFNFFSYSLSHYILNKSTAAIHFLLLFQDGKGPFISLIMVYIFSAMTNLAIEVRLMAFKFLDLVIQNYPSTFSMYAEKVDEPSL